MSKELNNRSAEVSVLKEKLTKYETTDGKDSVNKSAEVAEKVVPVA